MIDLADLIRTELPKHGVGAERLRRVITAVLDTHPPFRVYDDCGHNHDYEGNGHVPDGVIERLDGTLICEAAHKWTVCLSCCTWEFGVTDECMSNHAHDSCYPCRTVRVIGEQLGLIAADTSGEHHG